MSSFAIPHLAPIRFVKKRISATLEEALVEIAFDEIPTLGMLIEAAVQSSSGILNDEIDGRVGFLVSLKNVKLLQEPNSTVYQTKVYLENKLGDIRSLSFTIYDNNLSVSTGSFVVGLQ